MPEDLAEAAKIAAAEENRSLSNYIVDLISRDLKARAQSTMQEGEVIYKVSKPPSAKKKAS